MKKKFKKISSYTIVGGFGAILMGSLSGCQNGTDTDYMAQNMQNTQNAFVIIEEISPGKYQIQDEFPSKETRIVLKQLDGNERVLTKEEMDALISEEYLKIESGSSNLTKNNAEISNGFSLGEAVLASAAGAILGSWIGSKLFNNQNYTNYRQKAYKNPSTYARSVDSFNKAKASPNAKASNTKKGFFGNSGKKAASSGSFGG